MDVATSKTLLQRVLAVQITEKQLIQIISEEIDRMIENNEIDEGVLDRLKATASANINPFASQANKALKKAASVLGSYSNHLLKLQQKLDMDAQKLGIDGSEDLQRVSSAIEKTQQQVQQVAKGAPTSEKMKAAIEQKFAAQQAATGGGQQQATQSAAPAPAAAPAAQPAAQPAAPAPAAAPAATPAPAPAAAPAATPAPAPAAAPAAQRSQSPRNVRRRAARAAETPEQRQARLAKRRQRDAARRAARRQAAQTSAPANESKVDNSETLNEQLQKISERWGFGK